MSQTESPAIREPRLPTLAATALLSLWIALLSLPLWSGRFLGGVVSDQYHSGYAFRHWLAEQWKRTGRIPLWNPELYGGLPFVGAMHGDIFYPTSWLRLVLPTGLAMGLGFVIHYVLAGLFLYALLRALKVSWIGAVTGGAAYQLSGVIGSYVAPGHDGKLFVTAMLPLVLLGLLRGMRDGRPWGFGIAALGVGLALLSPHAQMTYYLLVAAGLFALYLSSGGDDGRPLPIRARGLGLALAAVLVGFGIGMIQILPFLAYLPYSPRAQTYGGFERAISYGIPWSHVPEFLFPKFVGTTQTGTYWGENLLKLHSEYLGLGVVALAVLGVMDRTRRRLIVWLGGIGALFLLVGLGGATPFYRLWWSVMPFMKQVRAPGMAIYVVCLVVAIFAALGAERVERAEAGRWGIRWVIAGAVVALLGLTGVLGTVARSLAEGIQTAQGRGVVPAAVAAQSDIRAGAVGAGIALAAIGGVAWGGGAGRLRGWAILGLPVLVGADLWLNARAFWQYSERAGQGLYGGDAVTQALRSRPQPARVLDLSAELPGLPPEAQLMLAEVPVYPGAALMAFAIPQLLGHHAMQPHAFNELLGGRNQWTYLLRSRRLWDLLAVRYVLLPAGTNLGDLLPAYANLAADYDTLMTGVATSSGGRADLLVRRAPAPYARLVPAAVKVPDDNAIPTVADARSRLDFDRLVLLAPDAAVQPAPVDSMPPPLDASVRVEAWEPGRMTLAIEPAAPQAGYILVAENWQPGWEAAVDGQPALVVRGDVTLITVPVTAGARRVDLVYRSPHYARGRLITLASLLLLAAVFGAPVVRRRRG
jgi:hypothetical protein